MTETILPRINRFLPYEVDGDIVDEDTDEDIEMEDVAVAADQDLTLVQASNTSDASSDRLVIAVDFGTTFSSVAYARIKANEPTTSLGLKDIKCISNYPDDPLNTLGASRERREDVPTELWYKVKPPTRRTPRKKVLVEQVEEEEVSSDADDVSSYHDSDDEAHPIVEPEVTEHESRSEDQVYWGFGVQEQLQRIDVPKDGTRRITRFKLMLDASERTYRVRMEVGHTIRRLKARNLISHETDVFVDYLQRLLGHTKNELIRMDDYNEQMPIEFVLCIPAVWPAKACRVMQSALKTAVQESGLGKLSSNTLENLFIMSEPEAAANCVLAEDSNDIYENETIVIIDAGGGTVDAVTYSVENAFPLRLARLKEELIPAGTELGGGSFVNEEFEIRLLKKLQDESYLEVNGKTIQSIVQGKAIEFENKEKRRANIFDDLYVPAPIWIDDLQPNASKKFTQNRVQINAEWMKKVFEKPMGKSARLLRQQLESAKAKGYSVSKVILVGGFSQSPSLRARIQKVLRGEKNQLGQEIQLLTPPMPSTTVARGAVLRALNKEYGPRRISSSSYGFLITEPWEPRVLSAHLQARPRLDKADGERYINDTIDWRIQKDDEIPQNHVIVIRKVKHTFKHTVKNLICREALYISDHRQESHYRKGHVNNKNAELTGYIVANMTFLKTEGKIELQHSIDPTGKLRQFWAVEYDLLMIIDGRNLRYEARWPALEENDTEGSYETVASGQMPIAAGFQPGTA